MITKYTTYRYTYIKENFESKIQEFLFKLIEDKLNGTDFSISKNSDNEIYLEYRNIYDDSLTDLYWMTINEFNLEGLEETVRLFKIYSSNSNYKELYKELNILLQEIIADIKNNHMHLFNVNKFDLL